MKTISFLGCSSVLALVLAAACSDEADNAADDGSAGEAGETTFGGSAGSGGGGASSGGALVLGGSSGASVVGGAGAAGEGLGGAAAAGEAGSVGDSGAGGALGGAGGDASGGEAGAAGAAPLSSSTVLNVDDVAATPEPYGWFDFRPNVKKLILAGAAETQHVAILWYTVIDGGVGLHYHSKTESVYVIDGTQTDAKGSYTDGTVYFNPPGSGHQITDSSGFFLLAYAAPPDFANTNLIEAYTPVRIDTAAADLTTAYVFAEPTTGVKTYAVPVADGGGLTAQLIETTSSVGYAFMGNYLLVLKGSCDIEGVTMAKGKLVVAKAITPQPYELAASSGSTCLAMGVSF